jgi:hypothetical protein
MMKQLNEIKHCASMYSLRVQRNTVTSQREFTFILLQTKEEQNEENENTAANAAAPRAASQRSPDTEISLQSSSESKQH